MIFSDNVPVEDEVRLKQLARAKGLLALGPDCGTAIIGGVPLGFANAVRRGPVGVVGASGTGMQEITTLVDRFGGGVSHAIGTGSHDLSAEVGAITTIMGLEALAADSSTRVIVVVSKPPNASVAERVLQVAKDATKPVVVCFLGLSKEQIGSSSQNFTYATSLEEAAREAIKILAGGIAPAPEQPSSAAVNAARSRLKVGQKFVRGLFSGGTFCYEAMLVLEPLVGPVRSNTPLRAEQGIAIRNAHDAARGGHICLDLGSDEFTVGRPHPMIDMSLRAERIVIEAEDPETAVLLLDVVLGFGAHPDPASALAPAIRKARARAGADGRDLAVVASICGTDRDTQDYAVQKEMLEAEGVLVAASNASAARLAGEIVRG
jgi:FdrA protein